MVHYATKSKTHDTIKDGGGTDIVVSVPLLTPVTPGRKMIRQAVIGGEGKMLFELSDIAGPDHKRLPSGPLRNKAGKRSSHPLKGSSRSVPKGGIRECGRDESGESKVNSVPGPAQICQRAKKISTIIQRSMTTGVSLLMPFIGFSVSLGALTITLRISILLTN
jgi:hypothetical protein